VGLDGDRRARRARRVRRNRVREGSSAAGGALRTGEDSGAAKDSNGGRERDSRFRRRWSVHVGRRVPIALGDLPASVGTESGRVRASVGQRRTSTGVLQRRDLRNGLEGRVRGARPQVRRGPGHGVGPSDLARYFSARDGPPRGHLPGVVSTLAERWISGSLTSLRRRRRRRVPRDLEIDAERSHLLQ
jgi:hypothetical protein